MSLPKQLMGPTDIGVHQLFGYRHSSWVSYHFNIDLEADTFVNRYIVTETEKYQIHVIILYITVSEQHRLCHHSRYSGYKKKEVACAFMHDFQEAT